MNYKDKIKNSHALRMIIRREKARGKTIVQCHGCFDIVHPGHIRHLKFAKEQGDILVVSVSADSVINKGYDRPYVPQDLRAENLAALEFVDYICIDDSPSAEKILALFRPDIYIKGKEFEDDYIGRIGRERGLVESYGGKVMFSSGDVVYSSTYIIENQKDKINLDDEKLKLLCERNNLQPKRLFKIVGQYKKQKIIVIGDTIVDEYVYCDPLGMSAEAPVLAVSPRKRDVFLGGAAIVAAHAKDLGGKIILVTALGDDERADYVRKELDGRAIQAEIFVDKTRPTTLKQRYMAEGKKLLKVNHFKDHEINHQMEKEILRLLKNKMSDFDSIIISDSCYGVITPFLAEGLSQFGRKQGMKIVAGTQSSTQLGNIAKFKKITLTVPSEREARLALGDHRSGITEIAERLLKITDNDYLVITVGEKGMIVYNKVGIGGKPFEWRDKRSHGGRLVAEYFPAFSKFVVDPMGSGDAALAGFGLSLSAGASIMESAYIASSLAAVAVKKMGNIPVQAEEVKEFIRFKMSQSL